jgi:hypothetical protein
MRGVLILLSVFILSGCREPIPQDVLSKMDMTLRSEVQEESREEILFSGQYEGTITEDVKEELVSSGIVIQTVAGEVFSARGRSAAIVKLARMEGVVRLESGKKVRPLDKIERGSS